MKIAKNELHTTKATFTSNALNVIDHLPHILSLT